MVIVAARTCVAVIVATMHLAWAAVPSGSPGARKWPWLGAMVGYTMVSLWLLAQPLIEREVGH